MSIRIAIDGPAGAGKSTISRSAAKRLGFIYIDTGALYRTVGLAATRANVEPKEGKEVDDLLTTIKVELSFNDKGEQIVLLNGEDVSAAIRMPEISLCASDVSALPAVRAYLLEMQRKMAREHNVIMDGRDIGTVVLPDAELKIFLTASAEARAERRLKELAAKGVEADFASVLRDIRYRDEQDSSRAAAPLRPARDSVTVDTTEIDFAGSEELLCRLIREKLGVEEIG